MCVYIYTDTYIHKYMVFNSLIQFKHILFCLTEFIFVSLYHSSEETQISVAYKMKDSLIT